MRELFELIFTVYLMIGIPIYLVLLVKLLHKKDFSGAALSVLLFGFVIALWPAFLGLLKSEEAK